MRNLLDILFKRKILILSVFLVIMAGVAWGLALRKTFFSASATLMVKVGRDYVVSAPQVGENRQNIFVEQQEIINSEIKLLQNRILVEKVIKDIGPLVLYPNLNQISDQATGWIETAKSALRDLWHKPLGQDGEDPVFRAALMTFMDQVSVEGLKKSNLIIVRFKHADPGLAAQAVNKLAEYYLEHHLSVHKRENASDFFNQQAEYLKARIFKAEQRLNELKKGANVTSISEQKSLLLKQHSAFKADLNQALSAEAQTARRLREFKVQLASTPSSIPQRKEEEVNNQLINSLQSRLVELELREKELMSKYRDESRLVVSVRDEIAVVRQKLGDQEKKFYGKSMTGINPMHQRIQEDLLKSEAELKAFQAKINTLREQIEAYQNDLDQINEVELQIDRLSEELEVDRRNYRLYLTKYEESRISSAMDTEKISNVTLVEKAKPPLKPATISGLILLTGGVAFAVLSSIGSALIVESLSDHIERSEDLEDLLGTPVLTTIPELKFSAPRSG